MYLFIWLHHVLFAACGIYSWSLRTLSCGMRVYAYILCGELFANINDITSNYFNMCLLKQEHNHNCDYHTQEI